MAPGKKGGNKMFDQLTESNPGEHEAKGRRGYFIVTALIVGVLFLSGVVWSLYGKDLVLGGDMELTVLVTPVAPTENAPRPPQPKQERRHTAEPDTKVATRQTNMLRIDEISAPPKGISTTPNTNKARTSNSVIDPGPETGGTTALATGPGRPGDIIGGPETDDYKQPVEVVKTIPPPPAVKIEPVEPKKVHKISGGVVNGKAISLPVPVYSPAAKAIGVSGIVNVEVTIDESGRVVSAKAVTGHALLRQSAERAANNARFRPTLLSNEPVKVTGVIVYNFTRN
jgi:protein TonB